ncbi:MAG: GNAT family N-acetyltransferase, partial [Stackebrandtia sp.]
TRDLSVPGGVVPAAHVTKVGVTATHRRRGLLSRLMRRQLTDVGEPVAVLWASQPGIYGRYGYAPAVWQAGLSVDLPRLGAAPSLPDTGRLRELTPASAIDVLAPLLREYQSVRAGVSGRVRLRWESHLDDPSDQRDGATARRIVIHYGPNGEADGYALWRGKPQWDRGPAGVVLVEEVVSLNPTAYAALWRHLLSMDMATTVQYRHATVDEPLRQLVGDPRALGMYVRDAVWLRITDVPRALEARRYTADVDVVIEVADDVLPANNGRYRLVADGDSARCVRTTDPADLSMSVAELATVYLGGVALAELVAAGTVTAHRPEAVPAASAGFGWPLAPSGIEVF